MFQNNYKRAYDRIRPDQDRVLQLLDKAGGKHSQTSPTRIWKAALLTMVCCICIWNALPVCAANIPAFYRIIEAVSPEIADLFVPVEKSSVSQGVIMQVEAVNLKENQAEIIVSFQDEEGSDKISGKASVFDSYGLKSYGADSWIGGCSFIEYDQETDKAYFMISVQAEAPFDRNKLTFYVNSLLCGLTEEERDIDLSAIEYEADTKSVIISGRGGSADISKYSEALLGEKAEGEPRMAFRVLSVPDSVFCSADDFTITGVAYEDDILRVQICMGNNTEADRHVQPFLADKNGNTRHEDYSVSWKEPMGELEYTYYEYWFFGPFHNLEDYNMYGIFHGSSEMLEGEWEVTFRMNK